MVHPQLIYTSWADLSKLWPREVVTDQSHSSDQPDQSQKKQNSQKWTKNRLNVNTNILRSWKKFDIQESFIFQRCDRLSVPSSGVPSLLEHRRLIWDSIAVRVSSPILLTGVGVFGAFGLGEGIICVDARPIEKPLRSLDVATELESEFADDEKKIITIYSKVQIEATTITLYLNRLLFTWLQVIFTWKFAKPKKKHEIKILSLVNVNEHDWLIEQWIL